MRKGYIFSLSQYQPIWPEEFAAEKEKLKVIFDDAALEIEHIGSTAVEGLLSRPIVDIAVMIESHKDADGFTDALAQIGYEFEPQHSPPERHFYFKGNPIKYHLSVAYTDSGGFWPRQILFRDYLRSHKEARDEYANLKEAMSRKDPSGKTYESGKTEFVYRILRLAGWKVGQPYKGPHSPSSERRLSVTSVVPREDYSLVVTLNSGEEGILDMSSWVRTDVFHQIETYEDFRSVHVANDTIEWACGIALDLDYVYSRCEKTGRA